MREMPVGRLLLGPLDSAQPELRTLERLPGGLLAVGRAEDGHDRVAHEDQATARPQQPVGLRDPEPGVAPDRRAVLRERQVEGLVAERHRLGARVDERELHAVLALELPRGVELRLGDVEAQRPRAHPGKPRAPVARTAAQVDHVEAADLGEDPHLVLLDVPCSPLRRASLPRGPAEGHPFRGVLVPHVAREPGVVAERQVLRHRLGDHRLGALERPAVGGVAQQRLADPLTEDSRLAAGGAQHRPGRLAPLAVAAARGQAARAAIE